MSFSIPALLKGGFHRALRTSDSTL